MLDVRLFYLTASLKMAEKKEIRFDFVHFRALFCNNMSHLTALFRRDLVDSFLVVYILSSSNRGHEKGNFRFHFQQRADGRNAVRLFNAALRRPIQLFDVVCVEFALMRLNDGAGPV